MADTKKTFKGILQHTHDTFKNLSTEDRKGYLILVRDKDGDNSKNTEIWFGNRRYAADAETLINALDATVSGASSHVTVTVSEEDGKLTGITIVDDIDNTISQEINKLDATVSGNSSVDTALTQPLFVKVTEENGVLTGVEVKENIKSKYIDVLDANVSGNSKYVTVNVVETDGVVTGVNVSDTIDDAIANLNSASHSHANKAELDKVKDGDVAKWNDAAQQVEDFFILKDGEQLNDAFDTLIEVQKYITEHEDVAGQILDAVEDNASAITANDAAIKAEVSARTAADEALQSAITTLSESCSESYAYLEESFNEKIGEFTIPEQVGEHDEIPASGLCKEIEQRDADTLNSAKAYTDSFIPTIGGPDMEE